MRDDGTGEAEINPFPMREYRQRNGLYIPRHTIPWYLARIAHARLTIQTGLRMPLEGVANLGGFGVANFLDLLAGGNGQPPFDAFKRMIIRKEASVKDRLQIVTAGTPEFYDAQRELEAEADARARAPRQVFYQSGGGLIDKPKTG